MDENAEARVAPAMAACPPGRLGRRQLAFSSRKSIFPDGECSEMEEKNLNTLYFFQF